MDCEEVYSSCKLTAKQKKTNSEQTGKWLLFNGISSMIIFPRQHNAKTISKVMENVIENMFEY